MLVEGEFRERPSPCGVRRLRLAPSPFLPTHPAFLRSCKNRKTGGAAPLPIAPGPNHEKRRLLISACCCEPVVALPVPEVRPGPLRLLQVLPLGHVSHEGPWTAAHKAKK